NSRCRCFLKCYADCWLLECLMGPCGPLAGLLAADYDGLLVGCAWAATIAQLHAGGLNSWLLDNWLSRLLYNVDGLMLANEDG
ncbi:hypothetical protein Dimus_016128, partial [Dionaea muscipula]